LGAASEALSTLGAGQGVVCFMAWQSPWKRRWSGRRGRLGKAAPGLSSGS